MASKPDEKGMLSTRHIARLASVISDTDMETIALDYLGLKKEMVKTLRTENNQSEVFNRAIITKWKNMNSGKDQVKVRENRISLMKKKMTMCTR